MQSPSQPPVDDRGPPPEPDATRGHVLIVDDNPHDLQYIVRVLREHGYTPHAANDPRMALAFVAREVPDLVLVDMHMPGIDGHEVCRRLKEDPRTRDVPVIFVSAESRVMDRVRAFSQGAVDYITKPFQDDEALARIGTHLSLRRVTARLMEEKQRAEEASIAKSQFLANMSHELRTPLNAVLGYAQLLKMAGGLDARQQRGVEAIHESGEHLLRLINDVLDLARIEAGKMQLMPAPASLSTILRFVSHVIGVRAEQKGLGFESETAADLPPAVMVDEKRLSQVLLNLLGNAVKFTAQGKVVLRARVLGSEASGAARLRFEVEDTGPGIAGDDIETIFQPFEQAGPAHQRAAGVGLGLAISRRIVHLMGSDIRVESEPGVGSRFWFDLLLPLGQTEGPMPGQRAPVTGYEGPRKTVLVVDDVAANRDIAAHALTLAGFRTLSAVDGRDALEKLRDGDVDMVVLDMWMPVMDGVEALRRIRQSSRLSNLPVIAVSASSYESDHQHALRCGANAFLPKPLDFERLFEQVGQELGLTLLRGA